VTGRLRLAREGRLERALQPRQIHRTGDARELATLFEQNQRGDAAFPEARRARGTRASP